MPIIDINATSWDAQHDVDDAFSAASYRAAYEFLDANKRWDPTIFNTTPIFKGETNPTIIRILDQSDGLQQTVIQGVVDRSSFRFDGRKIVGEVAGRDFMSFVLDRHPTKPFTIPGSPLVTAPSPFADTFQGAISKIAAKAGIQVVFVGVPNYQLGKPVPVTIDRTFGDIMQELISPFRITEKFKVDAWMEGQGQMVIAQRNYVTGPRGNVTVDASRILSMLMAKTSLISITDARVEGAQFRIEVPEEFCSPTVSTHGKIILSRPSGAKVDAAVDETNYYDGNCNLVRTVTVYNFLNVVVPAKNESVLVPWVQVEEITYTFVPPHIPAQTEDKLLRSQTRTIKEGSSFASLFLTFDEAHEWLYFVDAPGTVKSHITGTRKFDSKGVFETHTVETKLYRRTGAQTILDQITESFDASGVLVSHNRTTTISPTLVDHEQGKVASPGKKMVTSVIVCGPNLLTGTMRLERNELLGTISDCCLIRGHILGEHASTKIAASFSMAPDLRVKPGIVLTIQNAPSFWPATMFYITSVRISYSRNSQRMDVEGLTWV
jgi:hypothetical protein